MKLRVSHVRVVTFNAKRGARSPVYSSVAKRLLVEQERARDRALPPVGRLDYLKCVGGLINPP